MMTDKASLWAAARRFEGVLRNDPGAYSFAPLADIYRQLGLLEDALETARNGARLHPDFASGRMALARAAIESGFRDEAVKSLEAVVRITPENIEAQRLLADLYTSAGNPAAAARCIAVADSLDMTFRGEVLAAALHDELPEEELLDADILELSDEFIEDEEFDGFSEQFSASPERPSLGDAVNRAEPFLMATPPPLYAAETAPAEPAPAEPAAVMASATIAELYINQGFPEKGAEIYRELLTEDPLNQLYNRRLQELTAPEKVPSAATESSVPDGLLDRLQQWLGNIGRVRECRTKSL